MTNSQTDSHTSSHIKIHIKRIQNAFSSFPSQFRFNTFSKMIYFTFYQVNFFQNTLYMTKQLKPYFALSHIKVQKKMFRPHLGWIHIKRTSLQASRIQTQSSPTNK